MAIARTTSTRRRGLLALLAVIAVGLAAAGVWAWWSPREGEASYRTAPVERGPIRVSISATGTLSATSTVTIGSQVSGLVEAVNVDFNDRVSAGQVIARIDPKPFAARRTQAQADHAAALAGLAEARATLKNAEADHARKSELVARKLIARADADLALAARDQAKARVASAQATVLQRSAAVENATLDIGYSEIRSPVDGVVLSRTVEPGQTVAASLQAPVLFTIAEDLREMKIELAIDEADVGQLRAGQPVSFAVDAFPDRRFRGEVAQVRLAATNLNNVITYPVVVRVDNADMALLPGMTANAEIEVDRRDDALRVPNAALRFRPAGVEPPVAGERRGAGFAEELPRLAEGLQLTDAQRAAFERALAAMRERAAQRQRAQAQAPTTPGLAGGGRGGRGGGNTGGAREGMGRGMTQAFSGFRSTLDPPQQARWDEALRSLFEARRATVWKSQGGEAVAAPVRLGVADANYTEIVSGPLREGEQVIVGAERPAA